MEEAAAFFAERLTPQADGGLHAALCLRGERRDYRLSEYELRAGLRSGLWTARKPSGQGLCHRGGPGGTGSSDCAGAPLCHRHPRCGKSKERRRHAKAGYGLPVQLSEHCSPRISGGVPALSQEPGRQRTTPSLSTGSSPRSTLSRGCDCPLCRRGAKNGQSV